ncbi:MAG: hypothetical protein R2857_07480 [Vampirovibrionales bacterium]
MLNIADGSAQSIVKNLQRMRELTKQAANDTYGPLRADANPNRVDQIKSEITRLADAANFNGIKLLNASAPANVRIQVGSGNDTTTGSTGRADIASALGDLTAPPVAWHWGSTDVSTNTMANQLASRIDTALTTVNNQLATLGAYQTG